MDLSDASTASLIERGADSWRRLSGAQRELLQILAELDRRVVVRRHRHRESILFEDRGIARVERECVLERATPFLRGLPFES